MFPAARGRAPAFLRGSANGHSIGHMATTTIRSTYVLDVETVRALKRIAQRWQVSKSEALRRVIRAVAGEHPATAHNALDALDRLQQSLNLSPAKARAWARQVRTERRAWSIRSETRGR